MLEMEPMNRPFVSSIKHDSMLQGQPMYGQTAPNNRYPLRVATGQRTYQSISTLGMAGEKILEDFKERVTCIFATPPEDKFCHEHSTKKRESIVKLINNFLHEIKYEMIQASLTYDIKGLTDAVIEVIAIAAYEQWMKVTTVCIGEGERTKTKIINVLKSGSVIKGRRNAIDTVLEDNKILLTITCTYEQCQKTFWRVSPDIIDSFGLITQELRAFVLAVLHSLKPIYLQGCELTNDKILEAAWQQEFYRAATMIMPPEMHITQEKSTLSGGRVDFTVEMYAGSDLKVMWCIELVREGSKLHEHVKRFDVDNGKYYEILCSDYIIIDFRSQDVYKKSEEYNKVWFVQHKSNFEILTVKQIDEEGRNETSRKVNAIKEIKLPTYGHKQCSLQEKIYKICMEYENKTLRNLLDTVCDISLKDKGRSEDTITKAIQLINEARTEVGDSKVPLP